MAMADSELVINIDTGVITFRNEENDTHCNCVPISRKHAEMVDKGELPVDTLVAAIKAHLREKREFDFDKYIEERRRLNVRKSAMHVGERKTELADRSAEMVSDAEIAAAKASEAEAQSGKVDIVEEAVGDMSAQDNFIPAPDGKKGKGK